MGELFAHPRLRNAQMDRVPLSASESDRFLLKEGDLLFARQSLCLRGWEVLDLLETTSQ
ncbi:MAG: hypothetical protein U1F51_11465 [Burkholderiales bacterium]